jgi:hypothetical protein
VQGWSTPVRKKPRKSTTKQVNIERTRRMREGNRSTTEREKLRRNATKIKKAKQVKIAPFVVCRSLLR